MTFVSRLSAGSLLLALGCVALSARPAHAEVLFSSMPFVDPGGFFIIGPNATSFSTYQELAAQFTPGKTATLDSIEMPFYHFKNSNDAVTISLYTSVNNLPGVVLATQTIPANTITSTGTIYTLNFGGSPLLTANTSYFVDAATTTDTVQTWNLSSPTVFVHAAQRSKNSGPFTAISDKNLAFRVNGTSIAAVPEPGSIALLIGLGVSGAGFLARRRRTINQA